MFVPVYPHTTVVNKTIVYSDTVLPLKDSGENLKVTSVDGVSKYLLKDCLKKVFESNPNVVFNTIQYSKEEEKVYFYTDKEISIKEWEDRGIKEYKPLTSGKEILETIKEILSQDKCENSNCVSLYDVLIMLKKKHKELFNLSYQLQTDIEYLMGDHNSWSLNSYCVKKFDFKNMELTISHKQNDVVFVKKDGDLIILKSDFYRANNMLANCGKQISEYFDKCIENRGYYEDAKSYIQSFNSNFLVDIDKYNVSIFVDKKETSSFFSSKEFKLSARAYDSSIWDPFKYECNSNNVAEMFRNNELQIFSRIFVKITDCPEWMQERLYAFRQEQLKEQIKEQKRLELKRKIFPWTKK